MQGKIYMTHPTKAIYGELLKDFVRLSRGSADEALYKEEDLKGSVDRIQVLDFHQTIDVDGIQVRPWQMPKEFSSCIPFNFAHYHMPKEPSTRTHTP